jgi:hypothetical protein
MKTPFLLGLAIFYTTRELDTNTTRKNRVWVLYNRVRVNPIVFVVVFFFFFQRVKPEPKVQNTLTRKLRNALCGYAHSDF